MVSDPDQTPTEYHVATPRRPDTVGQADRRGANRPGSALRCEGLPDPATCSPEA